MENRATKPSWPPAKVSASSCCPHRCGLTPAPLVTGCRLPGFMHFGKLRHTVLSSLAEVAMDERLSESTLGLGSCPDLCCPAGSTPPAQAPCSGPGLLPEEPKPGGQGQPPARTPRPGGAQSRLLPDTPQPLSELRSLLQETCQLRANQLNKPWAAAALWAPLASTRGARVQPSQAGLRRVNVPLGQGALPRPLGACKIWIPNPAPLRGGEAEAGRCSVGP